MEVATEIQAARLILNEGVEIPVPAPLLFRLFGKKIIHLTIKQPSAGVALRITKLRLGMEVNDEELENITVDKALALQVKHTNTVCRIVALLVLGGKKRGWLFSRLLGFWLKEKLPFQNMLAIMVTATLGGGVEDFINTIRLTRMLRLTMPNNQSQTT